MWRFIGVLFTLSLWACADRLRPVEDPSRPVEGRGYAILLAGKWFHSELLQPGIGTVFFDAPAPEHTRSVAVRELAAREVRYPVNAQAFLRTARRLLDEQCASLTLWSCRTTDIRLDPRFGALSVRFSRESAFQGPLARPEAKKPFARTRGYMFVHPRAAGLALQLNYTEFRPLHEVNDQEMERAFEEIVGGFVLRPAVSP